MNQSIEEIIKGYEIEDMKLRMKYKECKDKQDNLSLSLTKKVINEVNKVFYDIYIMLGDHSYSQ